RSWRLGRAGCGRAGRRRRCSAPALPLPESLHVRGRDGERGERVGLGDLKLCWLAYKFTADLLIIRTDVRILWAWLRCLPNRSTGDSFSPACAISSTASSSTL